MPGILGILSEKNDTTLFNAMQKSMDHLSYSIYTYKKEGIYLANICADQKHRHPRPIVISGEKYVLAFYGEIFSNNLELKPENCSDGEYLVTLFARYGLDVLKTLNGQYSACLFDNEKKTAWVIVDRYGTMPVYYAWSAGRLLFASEMKALIPGLYKKEINYHSIADLFSFGHLFGNKSMFREVNLVSPGSYIEYTYKGIRETKYWDFPYHEEAYAPGRISKKENKRLQEELYNIMMKAVKRMNQEPDELLFPLSGGLDSRYAVAMYHKSGLQNMTAFTMGPEISEDQMYAKEVAAHLGIDHYPFDITPVKTWENARNFALLSDGMSIIYGPLQNYKPVQFFYGKKSIIISYQMCDALFGSTLWRRKIKALKNSSGHNKETDSILLDIFTAYDQKRIKTLFRKDFFKNIEGTYKLATSVYLRKDYHPLHCYFLLLMNEHVRRGTLGGNLVNNMYYQTRMPSFDNDVFTFGWNLPIHYREHQYLYRMTFARYFPELAAIKREGYNFKIGASMFRYRCKVFENKLASLARSGRLGYLAMLYKPWNRPYYVDYRKWFRNELKKNILDFFTVDDWKSSEIINKEQAIRMFHQHLEGHDDFSGLLWQLINLEYFYRNYMDQ
ncbi:MAG: hypothetical protein JW723_07900 [Bacteroidales bacterium]|nr:hypothetical protein [Bacteroidales bacterium]